MIHKTPGVGTTVRFMFTTNAATGAAVAPLSAFEAADVIIYKDGSATQRTSTAGWTMKSPFDSIVGLHQIDIDLSDNTDAGFYAVGSTYDVVLSPDETVDGVTVVAVIGSFRIVAAESVAGVPKTDTSHIAGSAVSTTTAQIGVNVVQISTDATAADNAESFFDGTGYAGTNNVIPLVTTTTTATTATNVTTVNGLAANVITAAATAADFGTEVAAAVLAAATANPIDANIQEVNDVAITGDGQTGTEWSPA